MTTTLTPAGREDRARTSLFERYDRLNQAYEEAEKRLSRMHIPKPVYIVYESSPFHPRLPDNGDEHLCLGLQKLKGKWRICFGIHDDSEPGPSEWTPIDACSAEVRVEAAAHLNSLRLAVIESAEEFVAKVDDAIAIVERFAKPNHSDEIRLSLDPPKVVRPKKK